MPGVLRASAWAVGAFVLIPHLARAQQPEAARTDSLQQAIGRVSARLDSLERGQCPGRETTAAPAPRSGQPGGDSLAVAVEQLNTRLDQLIQSRCAPGAAVPAAEPADTSDDLAALRAAAAAAAGQPDTTAGPTTERPQTAQAGPRGANLLNPEISATGDIRLVARDESPQTGQRRRAGVRVLLPIGSRSVLEDEDLPHLRGRGDRSRGGLHLLHRTPREDPRPTSASSASRSATSTGGISTRCRRPSIRSCTSGSSVRRDSAASGSRSIRTLPFSIAGGTHEVWLQGTTSESEPLYEGGRQPTLLGRIQNFWQLSRSTYAQLGFTATGGDNDDVDLQSRLMGLDFRLTYRPPEAGTRRDITFRAEGYRLHSTEVGTTTNRYGTFLDLNARMSRRWILGARYDWVESPRGEEDTEWRITPTVTWWQSEFVYLRLEGEHADSDLRGTQNLLTFQAVWAFGPHKHETY